MGFAEHDLPGRDKFQSTGMFKEHKTIAMKICMNVLYC